MIRIPPSTVDNAARPAKILFTGDHGRTLPTAETFSATPSFFHCGPKPVNTLLTEASDAGNPNSNSGYDSEDEAATWLITSQHEARLKT